MTTTKPLPQYRCHKVVSALKIKHIEVDGSAPRGAAGSAIITPEDEGFARFRVDEAYCRKHGPQAGGYFVVYEDGYQSWSPAEVFEAGYTRIDGPRQDVGPETRERLKNPVIERRDR